LVFRTAIKLSGQPAKAEPAEGEQGPELQVSHLPVGQEAEIPAILESAKAVASGSRMRWVFMMR
jgi:hypothetical protein